MSLCITVVTPEGIAVAGESRQTQFVGGMNRVGSDNAVKVFQLTDTVLSATTGWGFLKAQGSPNFHNIASLVEDFKPTIPAGSTVLEIAVLMWTHFNALYQEHIAAYPAQAVQANEIALTLCVSGYNAGSRTGELYSFGIPSMDAPQLPFRTTDNNPGVLWMVTTDVVSRIMNGFDIRVFNLPFVQAANLNNNTATTELNGLWYVVNWYAMTLQDAIDFAVSMIQVTIIVQRFTAGTFNQMGGVASVGGPIDVAVVRPGATVKWVQRKELHI